MHEWPPFKKTKEEKETIARPVDDLKHVSNVPF